MGLRESMISKLAGSLLLGVNGSGSSRFVEAGIVVGVRERSVLTRLTLDVASVIVVVAAVATRPGPGPGHLVAW